MTKLQEYFTYLLTEFNDKANEYVGPYTDKYDFSRIDRFSVDSNDHMEFRYIYWSYFCK